METSKVKAQFFAMYLFQNVVCSQGYNSPMPLNHIQQGTDEWLLLRSIEQLNSDELKVVREILGTQKSKPTDIEIGEYCTFYYSYLRLIGVLIDFTYLDEAGKPQTLHPDEIIAKGWAKIQQP